VARYVAVKPIYYGGALAFAAGAQVPADHVERFGYLDAEMVVQVPDDLRGDAPELAAAEVDNTPPPPPVDRWAGSPEAKVAAAQRDFAATSPSAQMRPELVADTEPAETAAADIDPATTDPIDAPADAGKPTTPTAPVEKTASATPAAGDTNHATVTEA
jgi:hypothetical protein